MNRTFTMLAAGWLMWTGLTRAPAAPPPDDDTFAQILAAAANWTDGQTRAPLNRLQEALRAATDEPALLRAYERRLAAFAASTNGTPAARAQACRALGQYGRTTSVPVLAGLLERDDTADLARLALQPIPGRPVDDALVAALPAAQSRARLGLLGAIGTRRIEGAVGAVAPFLADADPRTAAAAADALGRIASTAAARALDQAIVTQTGAVRQASAEALLRHADRLADEGKRSRAAAVYARFLDDSWPRAVRGAAFLGAVRTARDPADELAKAICGPDALLRMLAIGRVRDLSDERQVRTLAGTLPELPAPAQIQLLAALADRGAAGAQPAVLAAVSNDVPAVRLAAFQALGALGGAADVPLLAGAAASGDVSVKTAARQSLYRLTDPKADAAILAALNDAKDKELRLELIRAVGARDMAAGCADLIAATRDSDEAIRTEAWRNLVKIAMPSDLPALIAAATADAGDRGARASVLEQVAKKSANAADRAAPFLAALPKTETPGGRAVLLAVLGRLGDPAALPALRAAAADPDGTVRDGAVQALTDWPTGEALPDLRALVAAPTAGERSRALARRAIVRLLRATPGRPGADTVAIYREASAGASVEERKLILAGVSELKTAEALALAAEGLADGATKAEAAAAVLQIVKRDGPAFPAAAAAALDRVLATVQDESLRKDATEQLVRFRRGAAKP